MRVVADGTYLEFYINGIKVWYGWDDSLSLGRVGVSMYRAPDSVGDELRVDWATLSPLGAGATRGAIGVGQPATAILVSAEEAYRINYAPPEE